MSGPFMSAAAVSEVLGTEEWVASPVFVVVGEDDEGKPKMRMVRNLSAKGEGGLSANDFANSEDVFATIHTAARCEQIVSYQFYCVLVDVWPVAGS